PGRSAPKTDAEELPTDRSWMCPKGPPALRTRPNWSRSDGDGPRSDGLPREQTRTPGQDLLGPRAGEDQRPGPGRHGQYRAERAEAGDGPDRRHAQGAQRARDLVRGDGRTGRRDGGPPRVPGPRARAPDRGAHQRRLRLRLDLDQPRPVPGDLLHDEPQE